MQGSWEPDFFIADWRVRPALGKLERGEVSVPVEPRAMQVLACLARHAPEVVSKQRLMREVWGDAYVTDEVMTHAVWELRKAFGDEAKNPRYIQTLARKGYRLLAEVSRCAAPEPLAAGSRIAQYEILEPVAGGAMGEVYKARDVRLGRIVALKFLPADLCRDPSARRRFLREAQAVAQLDHPNVATIYDTGESEGGRAYLALAFYEGETLQQKLERGPLPLAEAVGIARQIAKGLAAAHHRQIVHRDVKPANVVICPDDTVKILDFGLAKMAGATTLTRLGSSPGTPAYKSPEQTRGEKVDPRSDLWALGVVLYEMVTGRVPFGGEYEQAVIYAILNEPPKPLDGSVPPELKAVIDRSLAKDTEARYQTAEEMEADLAGILADEGGATTPRKAANAQRWLPLRGKQHHRVLLPMRRKWRLIVLSTLMVLGVALSVWQWWVHRWDFSPEVERWVKQGEDLEWRGDTKRILGNAENAYRKALALDPGNPLIQAQLAALLCRLGDQYSISGRRQEIHRLTEQAVQHAPDHPMPWIARAKLLLLENKPKEAEQAARKAIEEDPAFDRGHSVLGEALIAQGKLEEGLNSIRTGVALEQGYVRARLVLGAKLQDASRYDEAATEYLRVLEYDRDHPTAKENLGAIYLANGRYLDAIPLFREAFEMSREPRSANSLGIAYFNLNRMDEAIQAFTKAYQLDQNPTYARNLAESYEKMGREDEALRWYALILTRFDRELALGVAGRRAELLNSRAFCAAKLGRFEEALTNVQEARRLKPKQNFFLFRTAQIYAMAGNRAEVYSYTRQAVKAGFSREEFRRDLAFRDFQDDPQFREILESPAR